MRVRNERSSSSRSRSCKSAGVCNLFRLLRDKPVGRDFCTPDTFPPPFSLRRRAPAPPERFPCRGAPRHAATLPFVVAAPSRRSVRNAINECNTQKSIVRFQLASAASNVPGCPSAVALACRARDDIRHTRAAPPLADCRERRATRQRIPDVRNSEKFIIYDLYLTHRRLEWPRCVSDQVEEIALLRCLLRQSRRRLRGAIAQRRVDDQLLTAANAMHRHRRLISAAHSTRVVVRIAISQCQREGAHARSKVEPFACVLPASVQWRKKGRTRTYKADALVKNYPRWG